MSVVSRLKKIGLGSLNLDPCREQRCVQLEADADAARRELAVLGAHQAAQHAAAAQLEQAHCVLQAFAERLQADLASEAVARR